MFFQSLAAEPFWTQETSVFITNENKYFLLSQIKFKSPLPPLTLMKKVGPTFGYSQLTSRLFKLFQ